MIFCGLSIGLLTGCAGLGAGDYVDDDSARGEPGFVGFGADIDAATEGERQAVFDSARQDHQRSPTAESAIRLSIAAISLRATPLSAQEILSLLEIAERSTANESVLEFISFLRPIVVRLTDQQHTLEAESRARQSLEAQLDALKALEEQLDAPGGR